MNRFAKDIVIIFLSDTNTKLLHDTIVDHFFGTKEVVRWLDENLKRIQLAYVPVIEREFNVADPMEGTTARDLAQIFNSEFLRYLIKEMEVEIVPDLVADFSVFDRVEKRNMRRADMPADEILKSWLDNPAPLDQYRDDPQSCKGGAIYTPAFDNAGYYCGAVKGTQMACGDASTNYRLRKFSPCNTWRSPEAKYPWITDTDNSRDLKIGGSHDFAANADDTNRWETFSSDFVVGGRHYNEPNAPGGMGRAIGRVGAFTDNRESYMSAPPVNSECNTITQLVFGRDRDNKNKSQNIQNKNIQQNKDNFMSSPPSRYNKCGAKPPQEESMASSKPRRYVDCGINPYSPYKDNVYDNKEPMMSSKPKIYEKCNINPYSPYPNTTKEQMMSSKPRIYERCKLNPYAPYKENMQSEISGPSLNVAWRCNTGRIPDGGAGINFCDQSYLGGDLYYDMQFQTMFVRELNKDPEPHTFQPFGWACPESDNRLLSRRTFRNNEDGVENGIPRYERRLQRRNLDRDIDEDLRDTQYGYQQRGHDMSDLWTRTRNKKHIIDVDRDKLDITDKIRYDSLWQKSNYPAI